LIQNGGFFWLSVSVYCVSFDVMILDSYLMVDISSFWDCRLYYLFVAYCIKIGLQNNFDCIMSWHIPSLNSLAARSTGGEIRQAAPVLFVYINLYGLS